MQELRTRNRTTNVGLRNLLQWFIYLVFHEQNEPCHHNVDCIPQARILEQFGNLTSRETRKDQS